MALIALCLWVVVAWVAMVTLSPARSWPASYGLAAAGLPLLVRIGWSTGPGWGALGAGTMALVLRWPLRALALRVAAAVRP